MEIRNKAISGLKLHTRPVLDARSFHGRKKDGTNFVGDNSKVPGKGIGNN